MSATLNIEVLAKFFPQAPVIDVPGRVFPVDVRLSLSLSVVGD
jgi:HrpA-like RNA helicase